MLWQCLDSIKKTLDYPCEIIVNLDSADIETHMVLEESFNKGDISKLILNNGNNRGVGRSFENCLGLAEGNYIFKIDADLIFKPHWLSTAIKILDDNADIGGISLFDYIHYNPEETRFNHLEEREDCIIVDDFVSSIYGFRWYSWEEMSPYLPMADDGFHKQLGKIAITKQDYVTNQGFGLGKSVYVIADKEGNPVKAETYGYPKLFGL